LYLLKKIGFKPSYTNYLEKKKFFLKRLVFGKCGNKIISGYYKGVFLCDNFFWNEFDSIPKLLGTYELEVQEKIKYLCDKNEIKTIINFGAGEGYHLCGSLTKNFAEFGIAFEQNFNSRKALLENCRKNNIDQKITINGKINKDNLINEFNSVDINKSLFLIDIEGYEYELLTDENINFLSKSCLIIELHLENTKDYSHYAKSLIARLNKKFYTEVIEIDYSKRQIPKNDLFRFLTDDERFILISENRNSLMSWVIAVPHD
ncbi:hypothetical protein N9317_06060, partial [Pelagibacteraceae bacterium]|nr:hypothetical protein [Pelagibacteraceae bacterium]